VALYISGSKMDQIMRTFYMFFARMNIPFNFDKPSKQDQKEEEKQIHQ